MEGAGNRVRSLRAGSYWLIDWMEGYPPWIGCGAGVALIEFGSYGFPNELPDHMIYDSITVLFKMLILCTSIRYIRRMGGIK